MKLPSTLEARVADLQSARTVRLAQDRSMRTIDQDGHMHVGLSVISAQQVNGYLGRELPDWQSNGLQPDREYQILRPGAVLEKAASSFSNKPLMIEHRPQSAADHDKDLVVGSVANPVWKAPNLMAELVVWDGDAIRMITDGSRCALSSGYHFDVSMVPGVFQGQRFDGQMTSVFGNHVSLVETPRVSGAQVADSAPRISKFRKFANDMSETTSGGLEALCEYLTSKGFTPEEIGEVRALMGDDVDPALDEPSPFPGMPKPGGTMVAMKKSAMDEARRWAKDSKGFLERHPHGNRLKRNS